MSSVLAVGDSDGPLLSPDSPEEEDARALSPPVGKLRARASDVSFENDSTLL